MQNEDQSKQIKEMAKDVFKCSCVGTCLECEYARLVEDDYACVDVKIAEGLYNAGYRKSTDLAEEIFAEIEEMVITEKSNDGCAFYLDMVELAELKKKYTER